LTWAGAGWWAGGVAGLARFVGRERELSRLRTALGAGTRLLLVVGDAGVGKTRFAGVGVRRAAADGLVPVWGRCLPLAGKLVPCHNSHHGSELVFSVPLGCSSVLVDQAMEDLPALDPGGHIDRLAGFVQRRSLLP
jgi:hypothetical protein